MPATLPNKPRKGLVPDDYVYANEVAHQPASNRYWALQKNAQITSYLKESTI
jgi:hypothetical protein